MNLFFSSFAMRTAKARPIPEEQPVMRTTFWFIVSAQCLRVKANPVDVMVEVTGAFNAHSIIHRSATQQKPCAHGLKITTKHGPTHGADAY